MLLCGRRVCHGRLYERPFLSRFYQAFMLIFHGSYKKNSGIRSITGRFLKNEKMLRVFSLFPAALTFWILAATQTRSLERGTMFFILFSGIMGIMALIGRGLVSLLKHLSRTHRVIPRIAFRNLHRHRLSSISCFVTIAMGVCLINVIPQIKNGIQKEISRSKDLSIPGFFLFDIQPEQIIPLDEFLKDRGLALTNASPLVQGRINTVNGEGFYERLDKRKTSFISRWKK